MYLRLGNIMFILLFQYSKKGTYNNCEGRTSKS